ncbi:unnamed protein product [Arctogadus glacialis]
MEEMDNKPYQPLSKGRHEMEMSYTSSSDESEDGRAAHQRSYASRETLPDYAHELRLTLGSAHRERQAGYNQHPPAPHRDDRMFEDSLLASTDMAGASRPIFTTSPI